MEGQGDVAVLPPEGAGLEYPVDAGGGEFPGEGDEYAFLRIYDRFGDVQLTSFQLGKTASDPIAYFE